MVLCGPHDPMYSYDGDKKPIFRYLSVLSTCNYV